MGDSIRKEKHIKVNQNGEIALPCLNYGEKIAFVETEKGLFMIKKL